MSVIMIESPYSGDIDRNIRYLALCSFDASVLYDECPYASHACMTQHPRKKDFFVSDYDKKWDVLTRDQAIHMSQRMRSRCDKTVFYADLGWSSGMKAAREYCIKYKLPYEERWVNVNKLSEKIEFCSIDFCNALLRGKSYECFID
jgi:hypothetical protein